MNSATQRKPRAVVILGAGASAEFGVPVLTGMFKDTKAREYLQQDKKLSNLLYQLFWSPRGHTLETSEQSVTIEQILTIIRDIENEESVNDLLAPHEYDQFRKGLYFLIQRAVFEGKNTRAGYLNPLIDFCRSHFEHTTWASFNWDCIFEASFYYSQPRFEETGRSRYNSSVAVQLNNWQNPDKSHLFLKLHGGINWWMVNDRLTYLRWSGSGDLKEYWQKYGEGEFDGSGTFPIILEPSYHKYSDAIYEHLEVQWDTFLQKLLQAECVMIIGYSLPESDWKARSSILTAFQSNTNAKWLIIDPSEAICHRYAQLIGNKNLHVEQTRLSNFTQNINTIIPQHCPC